MARETASASVRKKIWLAVLTFTLLCTQLPSALRAEGGWLAVEFDPLTTALGARNLLVTVDLHDHVAVGAIGFSADFPDWLDDLMSYRNRDKNFERRIEASLGVVADYYFDPSREGAHLGIIAFLWNHEVKRNGDAASFSNLELLPRFGYRFFPIEGSGLYLDAFAGIQFEMRAGGSNELDGDRVATTPALPFATVHVGYHF